MRFNKYQLAGVLVQVCNVYVQHSYARGHNGLVEASSLQSHSHLKDT